MSGNAAMLPLAVVGCDFRIASSARRSKLVLRGEELCAIAHSMRQKVSTDGFAALNTCNRTEWIVSSANPRWASSLLLTQMLERAGGALTPYVYLGDEAVSHVFRVATGRESLVTGERQIASQFFDALERSRERRISSRVLNGLGTITGRLVRAAVRHGCMGGPSAGVHGLVLSFLEKTLCGLASPEVAVVGLGEIGRRVMGSLEKAGRFHARAVNRTVKESQQDAVRPFSMLARTLAEADAAVVCTASSVPVIGAAEVAGRRKERPLLLIDIGIPHQVDRSGMPAGVTVCGLDELVGFHEAQGDDTPDAAMNGPLLPRDEERIGTLMERAMAEFRLFCNQSSYSAIIDAVQRNHRRLVRQEIPRIVLEKLTLLPDDLKLEIGRELRQAVRSFTTDVFHEIRKASWGETL